jgi:hypothetical protein
MSSEENMDVSNMENVIEQPAETEAPTEVSIARKNIKFSGCLLFVAKTFQANQQ